LIETLPHHDDGDPVTEKGLRLRLKVVDGEEKPDGSESFWVCCNATRRRLFQAPWPYLWFIWKDEAKRFMPEMAICLLKSLISNTSTGLRGEC
jgi:hypothetical protein